MTDYTFLPIVQPVVAVTVFYAGAVIWMHAWRAR